MAALKLRISNISMKKPKSFFDERLQFVSFVRDYKLKTPDLLPIRSVLHKIIKGSITKRELVIAEIVQPKDAV